MNTDIPKVAYWHGRPIIELSREELFEVIHHLSDDLDRYRAPDMMKAMALGQVEMFRRGEFP